MTPKDVYAFYQDYVKPLYCEIEARGNQLPVELLFEIHAAFDHLKRFHLGEEDQDISSRKAISHLKRGSLDAFKLKLKYFNDDVDALLENGADLSLLDNGGFLPGFISAKNAIYALAKNARYSESHKDPTQAFEQWMDTSLKIDEFAEKYLTQEANVSWARRKTFCFTNKDTVRGALIGLVTGVVSCFVYGWMTVPPKTATAAQSGQAILSPPTPHVKAPQLGK